MSILTAAKTLVRDYPGRGEAMAHRLGLSPDTLRHQVAGAPNYKLGLEDAVEMTQVALETKHINPLGILNAFAGDCGCMVLPLPRVATPASNDCIARLALMAKEFADVAQAIAARAGDGDVSDNDLQMIDKEGGELIAAWQGLRAALVAANQASRDAVARGMLKVVA